MKSEQLGSVQEFDKTAVFFLAPKALQKLEVRWNTRFFWFLRHDFQIMLDGVCLDSGISEPELEKGKTYNLLEDKIVEIKFSGNQARVWLDGELISLNHMEEKQANPWRDATLLMYIAGVLSLVVSLLKLFPVNVPEFNGISYSIEIGGGFALGLLLCLSGYVARHYQKLWALWLGNFALVILLAAWATFRFWINQGTPYISSIVLIVVMIGAVFEQIKNSKKAKASIAFK